MSNLDQDHRRGSGLAVQSEIPSLGAVFWPVGTGDSTTLVVSDEIVVQIDLHDMAKADDDTTPEVPVVDRLVEALPIVDDVPYLAVFVLTHADKDHCLGFEDLLSKVTIGELWATPRLWREYEESDGEGLCPDAQVFQAEAERRVAAVLAAEAAGLKPAAGDRIIVFGYDTDHDKHAYDELPDEYKSGPGHSLTVLDGRDCVGRFEAFIHAPFADDCAAARNDTSLAMQITLTDPAGQSARLLLFGDLAHDTIMKIFDYSERNDRDRYVEWDLLLAPHHCSKKVMYVGDGDGGDLLQTDVLDAFARHSGEESVVVASSGVIPTSDTAGANPPHRKAADRYAELADEVICTMEWPTVDAPEPVVFTVDADGGRIVREDTLALSATEAKAAAGRGRPRLVEVAAAAATVAEDIAAWRTTRAESVPAASASPAPAPSPADRPAAGRTGPEQIRDGLAADRGGRTPPATTVGFGCDRRCHRGPGSLR